MKPRKKVFNGKKGFAVDMFLATVLLFVIGLMAIFSWFFLDQVDIAFQNNEHINNTMGNRVTQSKDKLDGTFDALVLTLFIGTTLSLSALSFVLRTNPMMFFLLLTIVMILGMVAGYLSNAWDDSTTSPIFTSTTDQFPFTQFIMQNYMLLTIINAFIMVMVFFAKPVQSVGGGFN